MGEAYVLWVSFGDGGDMIGVVDEDSEVIVVVIVVFVFVVVLNNEVGEAYVL